ncbi:MAG: TM2 domain-containing protein [Synechococcus sp.]
MPRAVSQADQPLRRLDLSYLLWCLSLVGICGVQRIYNRRPLSGVLYLLSFGLLGIGTVVDLFLIPSLVRHANAPTLLDQARAAVEPIDRQLLSPAARGRRASASMTPFWLWTLPLSWLSCAGCWTTCNSTSCC